MHSNGIDMALMMLWLAFFQKGQSLLIFRVLAGAVAKAIVWLERFSRTTFSDLHCELKTYDIASAYIFVGLAGIFVVLVITIEIVEW